MAVREDVIRANPVANLEGIQKPMSHAAVALQLAEVAAFRRLDMVDLWDFMLFTGCRIGEALALRWVHVDLQSQNVTFRDCSATRGWVW